MRKSCESICDELEKINIKVCPNTVKRLLKVLGYSKKSNRKSIANGGKPQTKEQQKERDIQFNYIKSMRLQFENMQYPIISIDTKKKELIGAFYSHGKTWQKEPLKTYDHDFRQYSKGIGVPLGIYDCTKNHGTIFIGKSYDTAEFEVDSLVKWWIWYGKYEYPESRNILILSDAGGSSGYRSRMWKYYLQKKFCERHNMTVTICHYPTGASKWNPIEHRLFSEISKNWSGQPLIEYETMLNYIKTTKTKTGLRVIGYFVDKVYSKGQKISVENFSRLKILYPNECKLNYVISSN